MRNVKLAFRTLFKTPFVMVVAIASLALGIGANAAIYSLFNEMLLSPLPVPHPERLVNLGGNTVEPGFTFVRPSRQLRLGLQLYDVPRPRVRTPAVHRRRGAHVFRANIAFKGQTPSTSAASSSPARTSRCSA